MKLVWLALGTLFLTAWVAQVIRSGWCNDESAHIPAGLYHWETGRMDAYRVNPPLPRMIAALPLLLDRPKIEWQVSPSPRARNEYRFADQWVADNQPSLRRYLLLSRSTVLVFFALGLWSITRWAKDLYGTAAAVVAGVMWALNPDVVTHAAVVAPDLPAASAGLLAGYLFWRWLRSQQRPFPWAVAAAVALAILCKFSWLFLLPVLPCVVLATDWIARRRSAVGPSGSVDDGQAERPAAGSVVHDAARLIVSFLLTLAIVNLVYGFEGFGTKLGAFRFLSQSLHGPDSPPGQIGNRFADGPLAWMPVPLPKQMVLGLDYLRHEFEHGMPCYLRGTWQQRGWWYFHLYAVAVKMPLGYWVLITIGIAAMLGDWLRGRSRAAMEWIPLLIAVVFVSLVSSQTGFTHHVRYVLPAYGFLFIIASRIMVVLPIRLATVLATACLAGVFVFHATHLGLAHTFFHPAAGGPNSGWRHLSYSNVDWGQSTFRMVHWIKEHPNQRPITVLFRSGLGQPQKLIAGMEGVSVQTDSRHKDDFRSTTPSRSGWYLLSSYQLTLEGNRYFWDKAPVEQPYPDVLLFYVPEDEALIELGLHGLDAQ